MNNVSSFLFVFLGGGAGACLRYFFSIIAISLRTPTWISTLVVNLIGCLFIFLGVKFRYFESDQNQLLLKIGLLGGLTTFSTFSLEVVETFKAGNIKEALVILLLNIVFGIAIGIGILR